MHLSDGVLAPPVLLAGAGLAILATARGLRELDSERLALAAMLAAAFFVAGTLHVPVGIGSVHVVLNGLAGLLLGWRVFPVLLVGLALQALLFSFGGFAVLGVNLVILGVPALLAYAVLRPLMTRSTLSPTLVGALASLIGVAGAIGLTALALALSGGESFRHLIWLVMLAQLPAFAVDMLVSALALGMLARALPALVRGT